MIGGFLLEVSYLAAAVAVLAALQVRSCRQGALAATAGSLLALAVTLLRRDHAADASLLAPVFVAGALAGPLNLARRPQLGYTLGGLALALPGVSEFYRTTPHGFHMAAMGVQLLFGFALIAASLAAAAARAVTGPAGSPAALRPLTLGLFAVAAAFGAGLVFTSEQTWMFPLFAGASLAGGFLAGRDLSRGEAAANLLPWLNLCAGLGAAGFGFALDLRIVIVLGALAAGAAFAQVMPSRDLAG